MELEVRCKYGDTVTVRITPTGFHIGNLRGNCLFLQEGEPLQLIAAMIVGGDLSPNRVLFRSSPVSEVKEI